VTYKETMTITNITTDNEYRLVKKETFQVTTSFDKSLFTSTNLQAAIWYIIKSERAFTLYNFTYDCLFQLRNRFSSFNILDKIPDDPLYVRDLLVDTDINHSYYDNLLIRIYQSFLGKLETFEFDQVNDFHVFDEFADTLKLRIQNRRRFVVDH
jgi:hypothetical protein